MIKNYLKIAWRNLVKNKTYALINIGGLAVGMATCLLITLYVLDEISYDHFHPKADRTYRIDFDIKFGGQDKSFATVSDGMGAAMKNDYPFIETFCRLRPSDVLVKKDELNLQENHAVFADNAVFEVFNLPLIHGDPKTALLQPNSVVLDAPTAQKYFGTDNALGKTMTIHDDAYKVTGVMHKLPDNTHLKDKNLVLSIEGLQDSKSNNWLSNNYFTYLVLKKGAKPDVMQAEFKKVVEKYMMPQIKEVMGIKSIEEFEKAGNRVAFNLTALTDIHLHSNKFYELSPNGSIQYVYIFSAIALFILLIACINFMNLSTARSANRAKEVGVRKVMGSARSALMSQFLTESVLTSGFALLIGVGIAYLILPYFNDLSAKEMNLSFIQKPLLFPILLLSALFIGLLSGIYPALFLSAFKPITVLKGKFSSSRNSGFLRSGLVVFQFIASVLLIISTLVIYKQLQFIQSKNLGFNREQVVVINDTNLLGKGLESFKNEIEQIGDVKSATISAFLPTPSYRNNTIMLPEGQLNAEKGISMQFWEVGHDYTKTLGMQMLQGRDFDKTMPTDTNALIINETLAKSFGNENPIGKKLYLYGDLKTKELIPFSIIGVVKNFNFESLRENIGAISMCLSKKPYGMISLRLQTNDIKQSLVQIESKWKTRVSAAPLNYQFLDEAFDKMYRSEQRIGKVFISFAILAILISCLGLFGLATFTAEQRTKEIGIRKVLGASVPDIIALLSKEFIVLVSIAIVIAVPLAGWAMNKWLQDFAYRIDISWWIFALAGAIALLIALLTVSFQAIKAAVANPVKSLRTE